MPSPPTLLLQSISTLRFFPDAAVENLQHGGPVFTATIRLRGQQIMPLNGGPTEPRRKAAV